MQTVPVSPARPGERPHDDGRKAEWRFSIHGANSGDRQERCSGRCLEESATPQWPTRLLLVQHDGFFALWCSWRSPKAESPPGIPCQV